jgi:omega-hydroxy-beta-dihydromenaquinone-9 sulfotransferase
VRTSEQGWTPSPPPCRPVFIIGCGRSGTTILYNILAGHPAFAWFSHHENQFPGFPELARLNPLYRVRVPILCRYPKYLPRPSEAYRIWDAFAPEYRGAQSPPLTEFHAAAVDRFKLYGRIRHTVGTMRASRFLNKNTRHSRRIRYLNALFPDAKFIHVIRDGRAVTHSLLNVSWWSDLKLWWADGCTPGQLAAAGKPEFLAASNVWRHEVGRARYDATSVDSDSYLEVHYEAFVQEPEASIRSILTFCDLEFDSALSRHIDRFEIREPSEAWRSAFSRPQRDLLEEEIGDLLDELGYRS